MLAAKETGKAEQVLWSRIRDGKLKGFEFLRHQAVAGNKCVVDFYCSKAKLAIKLDDGRGCSLSDAGENVCDRLYENLDIDVMWISNADVLRNTDAVVEQIYNTLSFK